MIPGEILTAEDDIILNSDKQPITLHVATAGDRPVQVGSHYHFYETNTALNLIARPPEACALILPPEQLSALSQVRNARFSLSPMAVTGWCMASIKKLWERYNASFITQKNLC